MNRIVDRMNNPPAPPTPNLQNYKLYGGKSKAKKKATGPLIQPTLQPVNMHTNGNTQYDRYPPTPTLYNNSINFNSMNSNSKLGICQNHPEKKAMFTTNTKDGKNKQFCGLCAVTDGGGDSKFFDQEKYEKTKSIQNFKKKASTLKQTINNKQKQMAMALANQQDKYGQYFSYLRQSFQMLIDYIEQKHSELNNTLIQSIQKRKQSLHETHQLISTIKQSIQRYIFDINKNYEQILTQLPMDNFRDIMKQYNTKIQYFNDHLLKRVNSYTSTGTIANNNSNGNINGFGVRSQTDINVYLPIQEIKRVIDKANIQYYGYSSIDCATINRIGSTRSLQKFVLNGRQYSNSHANIATNQKQQKTKNDRNQKADRKSQSKTNQQRKRNNTQNNIPNITQIRGVNKQNNFDSSYYNCDSDQRTYCHYD